MPEHMQSHVQAPSKVFISSIMLTIIMSGVSVMPTLSHAKESQNNHHDVRSSKMP